MRSAFPLVVTLLAGCTNPGEHSGFGEQPPPTTPELSTAPAPLTKTAMIHVAAPGGFRFEPDRLRVRAESVVEIEFENRDSQEHTFVVSALAVAVLAGSGQTVRANLPELDGNRRGRLEFFCSIAGHREAGMEGVLEVR